MPASPDLILDGLTRRFQEGDNERTVLSGASARIASGTFAALFGRSGSGKSTLLNLIAGIDLPTSGRVLLGDLDLTALSERDRTLARRRRIGFVFQQFNLIPTLTVGENVQLPMDLVGIKDAGRAQQLLGDVGLADRADAYPDKLSGGEQQRVAVARALAHDPDLILADEPTGNLDRTTADRVLDLLHDLARDRGKTLLVVTHDPAIATRADRVLSLRDGMLHEGLDVPTPASI